MPVGRRYSQGPRERSPRFSQISSTRRKSRYARPGSAHRLDGKGNSSVPATGKIP